MLYLKDMHIFNFLDSRYLEVTLDSDYSIPIK